MNDYIIKVKDGTAQVKIKKSDGTYTGLHYLEESDMIKLKGRIISNKIIIDKININIKYEFNSDSSYDLDIF